MKTYFKKAISFFIIFMFLMPLISSNLTEVFAQTTDSSNQSETFELPAKDNVSAYKNWNINFSKEVDVTKLSSDGIFITSVNSNIVPIKITQGETNKTVVINCPIEGYKPGETYYVNISKNMVSKIGSSVKKATKMKFTISTDENVNAKPAKFASNVIFFDEAQSKVALNSIQDLLESSDGTQQIVLKPNLVDVTTANTLSNIKSNLYNINPGQIFLFQSDEDNPNGLSGRVISVTKDNNGNTVITFVQPKIEELFSELEFKTKKELKAEDLISTNLPEGSTLIFNNEVIGRRDTTGGITKFSQLSLNIPRVVFVDKDGDKKTTEDQIALSGKIDLKNATLDTDIEIKTFSWKPLGIKIIDKVPAGIDKASVKLTADSHQEATLDLFYNQKISLKDILDQSNGTDFINTYPKDKLGQEDTDKTGFKAGIVGSDLGDRYVIGSATFGIGAVQASGLAEAVQGLPSKSIAIGATLFFTLTLKGEIKVSASFDFKNDTHIDTGMKYDGGKVTSIGTGITNEPNIQFILNGDVNLTKGLGVGAGLVLVGIMVATVTIDILEELDINGYVYYQKNYNEAAVFAGKLNGSLTFRVKGDAEWGLWTEIQATLQIPILSDLKFKEGMGIKPDSINLFNVKLLQLQFSLENSEIPQDVFVANYFNNKDLSGKSIFSMIDKKIVSTKPADIVDKEIFSVRWTGKFDFDAAKYKFTVSSDDGIRVYVDDKLVIDDWTNHTTETKNEVTLDMTAKEHIIKVEYFHEKGTSIAKCNWIKQ